jgi:asparagine synthase (glutamine-hydrolysing)
LAVAQACRTDRIKVLLTGEGSDELFGGYRHYRRTWLRWRRLELAARFLPLRRTLLKRSIAPLSRMTGSRGEELEMRLTMAAGADQALLPRRFFDLMSEVRPVADRVMLVQCFADLYGNLSSLLYRHDRMGMAASIEMRVPFLENAMFDLSFHLPRRAKLHQGEGKWLVKMAALDRLPRDIVFAKKKGFPVPMAYTKGTERILIDGMLAQTLNWSSTATRLIVSDLAGQGGLRFFAVGLEMWLRMTFAKEQSEDLGERLVALAA